MVSVSTINASRHHRISTDVRLNNPYIALYDAPGMRIEPDRQTFVVTAEVVSAAVSPGNGYISYHNINA